MCEGVDLCLAVTWRCHSPGWKLLQSSVQKMSWRKRLRCWRYRGSVLTEVFFVSSLTSVVQIVIFMQLFLCNFFFQGTQRHSNSSENGKVQRRKWWTSYGQTVPFPPVPTASSGLWLPWVQGLGFDDNGQDHGHLLRPSGYCKHVYPVSDLRVAGEKTITMLRSHG